MDEIYENGGEEDDDTVQQPMHAYNLAAVANIQLPDLDLDCDSDDSDEELEPLVSHPVLDQGKFAIEGYSSLCADDGTDDDTDDIVAVIPSENSLSTGTNNSTSAIPNDYPHEGIQDTYQPSVDLACGENAYTSPIHAGNDQCDAEITKLMGADLAEMELDNAILSLVPSHSLNVKSLSRGSSVNLSDSSGSGSSLLGKLEETMSSLKELNELENNEVEERLVKFHTKTITEEKMNGEQETVKLDLRHHQDNSDVDDDDGRIYMPTNQSVLLRYGRAQFSTIDEEYQHDETRRKLKEQSELIALNRGKLPTAQTLHMYPVGCKQKEVENEPSICSNEVKMNEGRMSPEEMDYSLSNGSSSVLVHSVDSMLENVNRIMCRGADVNAALPGKQMDAISSQTSSNKNQCGEENTNKYIIYDNVPGIETPEGIIKPVSNAREDVTRTVGKSQSNETIDFEMNTQLVDWADILQTEKNDLNLKDSDHLKHCVQEDISDSVFTNSFFSATKKTESNDEKINKKNSKPKTDILGTSKRKGPSKSVPKNVEMDCVPDNENVNITKSGGCRTIKRVVINHESPRGRTLHDMDDDTTLIDKKENIIMNDDEDESEIYYDALKYGDISYCNGDLEDDEEIILGSVQDFKHEIISYCHKNGNKDDSKVYTDSYRKLNFSDEKCTDEVKTEPGKRECLACQLNNEFETPMKHDESVCRHKNHMVDINGGSKNNIVRKIKKTTRSKGMSTNILNLQDVNKSNPVKELDCGPDSDKMNYLQDLHQLNEANKENSIDESHNIVVDDLASPTSEESPIINAKNSKNRKKKKSKNNKVVIEKTLIEEVTETSTNDVHPNHVQKKEVENLDSFWKELSVGEEVKILYDEDISFEESHANIPDTKKQLLVLKVPLESPGVCKANNLDSVFAFADQSSSDNYIGLITLFISLLQDSTRELTMQQLDIPFDVVSLQQAHLYGELLLIVGIVENKNTYQQKTKRTKLGTNFFHAVSQFLNTNYLDKILSKIWENTEGELPPMQNSLPFNHIWRQVELKGAERCAIPGSGKLSMFINISPDTNALQRIYSLHPSLYVHMEDKNGRILPGEFNWFQTPKVEQEYTCITVENATSISPKHVSELLKRLRTESIEICGMRIGYCNKDGKLCPPSLSICINEFKSTTVNEGKLLLSDCEELKELAISFHTQENISVVMNGSSLLKYTINPKRSHRQVVQWFGPHYKDVDELKNMLMDFKSKRKVSNNKNDKKKWAADGSCQCQLSLLNSFFSSAVLFISSLVPSAFIAFIISLALKKGLQLKMVYKTFISASQLGFPEEKGDVFADCDKRKRAMNNRCLVSCVLLLFNGKSAALRLLGLICKLTEVLNNPLTGETLAPWMVDDMIKFNPSHNTEDRNCKLSHVPREYFAVLHFNDNIRELLSMSFRPPRKHIVEDLYSILANVRINFSKPEINLMALVLYGREILKKVPMILRVIFSESSYQCLNSWRQSCRSRPFSTKHQPSIELLGAKYINSVSKLQACNLVIHEQLTSRWQSDISALHGNNAVIIIMKAVDQRTVTHVNESISKYILSLKLELTTSNLITHTDSEYVFRLMFQFFHSNELHGDILKDESQIPPYCLPDNHFLFTILNNVLDIQLETHMLIKKTLPQKDWSKILPYSDVPTATHVYQFCPSSLSFPLQLVLRTEKSYTGVSFEYLVHNTTIIAKALGRIIRMGFQMVALKFPCYDHGDGKSFLRAVLLREDAVFVLNKMIPEMESNYPKLHFTVTDVVHDVINYVHKEFKGDSMLGGIFHCTYFALLHNLNFEREECYDTRETREVEWNPQNCNFENGYWYMKKQQGTLSRIGALIANATDEVTVIILSEPLLTGKYLGKRLPESCIFPEILHILESVSYRMIASKTSMLTFEAAKEIVGLYKVDPKKNSRMVRLLSQDGGPFIALSLVGTCILSNFWLTIERKIDNEEVVKALKLHTLVPCTKRQVNTLLTSLFDKVLSNTKVELKTRLS